MLGTVHPHNNQGDEMSSELYKRKWSKEEDLALKKAWYSVQTDGEMGKDGKPIEAALKNVLPGRDFNSCQGRRIRLIKRGEWYPKVVSVPCAGHIADGKVQWATPLDKERWTIPQDREGMAPYVPRVRKEGVAKVQEMMDWLISSQEEMSHDMEEIKIALANLPVFGPPLLNEPALRVVSECMAEVCIEEEAHQTAELVSKWMMVRFNLPTTRYDEVLGHAEEMLKLLDKEHGNPLSIGESVDEEIPALTTLVVWVEHYLSEVGCPPDASLPVYSFTQRMREMQLAMSRDELGAAAKRRI
jgi:hypothetical protein